MTIPSPVAPADDRIHTETQIYAVGALKGGTGKSRLAMLIALVLHVVFGKRVVVFDADSGSQTGSNWPVKAMARKYPWKLEVIRHPFETLHEEIDKVVARGDVDYIVIDVGGGNVGAFQSAVRRAHKLIVPLCPDEGDLEQAPKTRDAAFMGASLSPYGCAFYYLLNRCEQGSRDKDDSREILLYNDPDDPKQEPYPLLDTDIPQRTAYKRAFGRIPRMKGTQLIDPDQPRWDQLHGFIPMCLETEILTPKQVLDSGLMTKFAMKKLVPMLLEGELISDHQVLDLGLLNQAELSTLTKELAR